MDEEALAATPIGSKFEEIPGSVDLKAFAVVVDRRIGSISKGGSALTAAEQSRIDELGSRAVRSPAQLADRGSVTLAELKNPTLWPNLRNRDDFRALVRRLEEGKPGVVAKAANPRRQISSRPLRPRASSISGRARNGRMPSSPPASCCSTTGGWTRLRGCWTRRAGNSSRSSATTRSRPIIALTLPGPAWCEPAGVRRRATARGISRVDRGPRPSAQRGGRPGERPLDSSDLPRRDAGSGFVFLQTRPLGRGQSELSSLGSRSPSRSTPPRT